MRSIIRTSLRVLHTWRSHPFRPSQRPLQTQPINRKVEEISIKVPWGHVAAKWWGPKNVRPILAMHGWQDNAGSFDRLIPLLPDHISYLAIDFPGQGLSSFFPPGMMYSACDYLNVIEIIRHEFQWDRLSILAHSMSSQIAFYHVSTMPEVCDMFIGIDALKPLVRSSKRLLSDLTTQFDKLMVEHERNKNPQEPTGSTMEELIELMYKATGKSVTREVAPHLLARAIRKSTKNPDKYYLERDNRIKIFNYAITYHELNLEMARKINAPHLFIKVAGTTYFENPKYYHETVEVLRQNPLFQLVEVEGTHHVHLSDPDKISGVISDFINKYRPAI